MFLNNLENPIDKFSIYLNIQKIQNKQNCVTVSFSKFTPFLGTNPEQNNSE